MLIDRVVHFHTDCDLSTLDVKKTYQEELNFFRKLHAGCNK